MVATTARGNNGRWLRKYRIFFIIGLAIFVFQIFLAARFLELHKHTTGDQWHPQSSQTEENSVDSGSLKRAQGGGAGSATNFSSFLRLEELDFKPQCEITGKEAISAIHRAKSQTCKRLIANVTCRSMAGQLYPKFLTGSCPNNGRVNGKALGCFKDENNYRLLNGYFGVSKRNNSPKYCVNLCLQSGFTLAGVEYSNECFCGNDEPPSTSKLPDSSCNMKCPGDNRSTCGGYYTINVYQTGIKKFVPRTANSDPLSEDNPPRIVFLLTLNGRALRQVKRLIKMLYHQNHYYYIHVDVREDYLFRELLPLERRFPNIRLTRNRFATIWGGASLLEMLLSCMSELLKMTAVWRWDFVLNLSESDYPVKLVRSLERFLGANRGLNFVKSHGRDTQRFLQKQGLDKTFVECEMRMWRVADRQLPVGLQMDGGSDWVALSRKFVNYVATDQPDELIQGLKQIFKHTLLPAESFFHTALRNSPFCDTYVDNNLHVTNWKRKLGCKCQYKHVVDWCGCSPNDFRSEDWARIEATASRHLYFARKFEPIVNQAVLLKLELWLYDLERPSKKVPNLHAYWQSSYHSLDLTPSSKDDGLLTVAMAAIRTWLRKSVTDKNHNGTLTMSACSDSLKIFEITSYHLKDAYKYTLVHFKNAAGHAAEIAFRPINNTPLIVTPSSFLAKRLEELGVSTDYDQKEQLSRNFPRILSPYSDFVAFYKFSVGNSDNNVLLANANMSLVWMDPNGVVVDISEIPLDENAGTGHSRPSLKQPHLPGQWTVKLYHKQLLLAEVKFLVTPLEFLSGLPLSEKQASLTNGGSISSSNSRTLVAEHSGNNNNNNDNDNNSNKNSNFDLDKENSRKIGRDLQNWIDSLFEKFYVVEDWCAVGKEDLFMTCGSHCVTLNKFCHNMTSWSSFAPDPKSAIGQVNQTSGMFDIW